jgi:hypothetical protein
MTKPKSRSSYRYADARRSRKGVGSRKKSRRGRNASRNSKHLPISDVDSTPVSIDTAYDDAVPREERSYTDIYTDLDIEELLEIVAPRVGRLTPPPEIADPQLSTPSQPQLTQTDLTRQSAPRSPSPSPRSRTPSPPPVPNISSPTSTPRRITPIFIAPPSQSPTAQTTVDSILTVEEDIDLPPPPSPPPAPKTNVERAEEIKRKILERIPKATFRGIEQDIDDRPFIRPEGHYVKHEGT